MVSMNAECLHRFFICFCLFYFHSLLKSASNVVLMLVALCYTSSTDLICYALFFTCYLMNLKCNLCQCLSRIISWYCSKVNTILTSEVLCTKVLYNLTHLYWRELLECMCSLLFSSQF